MTGRPRPPQEPLDASGQRFVVVASRYNGDITELLIEAALACLDKHGAPSVPVDRVPGAFELPLACRRWADTVDAIVALGCVIRGETLHFELVASECARGIMRVMLDTGVPIAFGVLATEDRDQALARAGGVHGNLGWEAAETAIGMASGARK